MSRDSIRARIAAATEGPWVRGWWSGQLPNNRFHDDCAERGPLLGTLKGGYHVHPGDFFEDAHQLSMGIPPFDTVAGNYDYEAGGIVKDADAAFIANARQDIPALLRLADALDGLLAFVVVQATSTRYECRSCGRDMTRAEAFAEPSAHADDCEFSPLLTALADLEALP